MGDTILTFIGLFLWGFICVATLVCIPYYIIIFIVAIIQDLWQRWKGKGGANYRFPPW